MSRKLRIPGRVGRTPISAAALLVALGCGTSGDAPARDPAPIPDAAPRRTEPPPVLEPRSESGGDEVAAVVTPPPADASAENAASPPPDPSVPSPDVTADTAASADERATEIVLPAGTRLEIELRTPLHSGTTLVGDRFAARVLTPLEDGGRVLVPARTLVEGRVAEVASADAADRLARIRLVFHAITLPGGDRRPIEAVPEAVEPEPAAEPEPWRGTETLRGAVSGAILGRVLTGGGEGAVVGAVLGSVAGMAIVGARPDHEIVVPSGTPLVVELAAPLRVPADGTVDVEMAADGGAWPEPPAADPGEPDPETPLSTPPR